MTRRALVAANWKMNGSLAASAAWWREFSDALPGLPCEVVVCPPFPYLQSFGEGAIVGAQDASEHESGAFTGEVSAAMLRDVGCTWCIVGHSERRQWHAETDQRVAAKAHRVHAAGLRPLVCIGETLAEREAGRTLDIVRAQLAAVLERLGPAALAEGALAYEPVWAIGTGRNATPEQAQQVHAALREQVALADPAAGRQLRILYGGSVKPGNAGELFAQPDIDGGLIGGASLVAADFIAICRAARRFEASER